MTHTKKTSLRSAIQRRGWPTWAALLLVVVLVIEVVLVCGSASLFNLIIPLARGLERPADIGTMQNAVHTIAFSPDGKMLATGTEDGQVRLWQVGDGRLRQTISASVRAVSSVAFSPDGTLLAAGSRAGSVQVWRVSDGVPQHTLVHEHAVRSIAFSPDGLTLAVGDWGGGVRLWSAQDGTILFELDEHRLDQPRRLLTRWHDFSDRLQ